MRTCPVCEVRTEADVLFYVKHMADGSVCSITHVCMKHAEALLYKMPLDAACSSHNVFAYGFLESV